MIKKDINILITNDDGIDAKGIKELAKFAKKFGNVIVVAPKEVQSGKSAAISLGSDFYFEIIKEEDGIIYSTLTGTPVDCVKMAITQFYQDKMPDLLLSGINHGTNSTAASIYSGTLGATKEGTVYGIPSIGLSIDSHDPDADFSSVLHYSEIIIRKYFEKPFAKNCYLNVNFPDLPIEEVKGIKMAYQGEGQWIKEFEEMKDENGRDCYIMRGEFKNLAQLDSEADHILMSQGYVTIVPHSIDTTDYIEKNRLKEMWKID